MCYFANCRWLKRAESATINILGKFKKLDLGMMREPSWIELFNFERRVARLENRLSETEETVEDLDQFVAGARGRAERQKIALREMRAKVDMLEAAVVFLKEANADLKRTLDNMIKARSSAPPAQAKSSQQVFAKFPMPANEIVHRSPDA